MEDWKQEIVVGVIIHQRLAEVDEKGLWSYVLPEVAASEAMIDRVEARLGFDLDAQYRSFLCHANGWRSFYQDVDILGTDTVLDGSVAEAARRMLDAVEDADFLHDVGLGKEDVLPIAASTKQMDMFLLELPHSSMPGRVLWYAAELIEAFSGFDEFYLSMLDYNRRQVARFQSGQ